ncbi:MAG TPA: SPOR domain-containing protein [Rhodocyclaceae bacterium]|nr:SPOR domain-containing protein [Rhodocyclaceae bacterium]
MPPRFARLLIASLVLASAALAHAASADVQAVQYPAWLERNGQKTPLSPGDGLRGGDIVLGGDANSRILLGMADGAQIKLGGNSRFTIEKLNIQTRAGNTTVDAAFKLAEGFFRYSSSVLGKLSGKRNIDLTVRTATIGIRGTDYWAMSDVEHDAVCVFDGKVEVATQDQGMISLDQPTAFWARFFDKPAAPAGNATPGQLARFIASVEPEPGNGVAIVNGRWRVLAAELNKQVEARELAARLRATGYPAEVAKRYGKHEVRINFFATRADAEAALKRLGAQSGLSGEGAKVVAVR